MGFHMACNISCRNWYPTLLPKILTISALAQFLYILSLSDEVIGIKVSDSDEFSDSSSASRSSMFPWTEIWFLLCELFKLALSLSRKDSLIIINVRTCSHVNLCLLQRDLLTLEVY